MIQYIELNQLSPICLYLVKVVLFENPELHYHFNMNVRYRQFVLVKM